MSGFQIEQNTEPGGELRLVLVGELDLSVAGALRTRLEEIRSAHPVVELDLSQLRFLDSTGLGVVLTAVLDARRDGWSLSIQPGLTRPVQRVVDIAGAGPYLWPEAPEAPV